MKRLVLLSDINQLHPLLASRLRELLGGKSFTLGYIPSQTDSDRIYFNKSKPFFSSIGIHSFVYFDVDEEYDERRMDELLRCDGVYLSGGNTFLFLERLKSRGMIEVIRRMVEAGKPLIGVSAGAIMMSGSIHMADYIDNNAVGLEDLRALQLVPFEFMPHWGNHQSQLAQFKDYSSLAGKKIYACLDGSGIIVTDGVVEKYGDIVEIGVKGETI
ncbi:MULTISPECIES: Type 1 glutamine amidotransferase-like domain-containing protein [Robertmurraya]|uniref:Type 1 glutamine amidotransferase-like domain-containing protein n=1 Tax=Robertmurraya beringensis TaxID=641660 RepID=A0ABV6KRF5_9BACI